MIFVSCKMILPVDEAGTKIAPGGRETCTGETFVIKGPRESRRIARNDYDRVY